MALQTYDLDLVNNQEQRLPCVLILDTSYSMNGKPIEELSAGLDLFAEILRSDDDASQKVQVLVVRCGGTAEIISDWCDAERFEPPAVRAEGGTPLGEAVELASREIEKQKNAYRNAGISYLKPWLFIISDGAPTDDWESEADELVRKEKEGKWTTFPIAVDGANIDTLGRFAIRDVIKLKGIEFKKLFVWISKSVRIGSQKIDDTEKVSLPPIDWSSV